RIFGVRPGWSLIELLTAISIIVLIVSILVPGLSKMRHIAKDVRQKSYFHSIEVSIELYRKDYDEYPESAIKAGGGGRICGAQHLAEALVGRDGKGYEPSQFDPWDWRAPGDGVAVNLYTSTPESLNRRKSPYIESGNIETHELRELYGAGNCAPLEESDDNFRAPVFTDVYMREIILLDDNIKAKYGSPILYYRANVDSKWFRSDDNPDGYNTDWINESLYPNWIYNYNDNADLINLGPVGDVAVNVHRYKNVSGTERQDFFYEKLTDAKASADTDDDGIPDDKFKPYNVSTYILISAGLDGIFGTKDDITNFNY
ncbi:MAG: hypothetical protein KAJ19_14145, partial [Gammaproteobacteria bacterium]|nr:hypothetical protein [Gammaproteobacteria bacterium]